LVIEVEYKGIEYTVVQTANPTGWKWIINLDESRIKMGTAFSRASAITFAEQSIAKHLKRATLGAAKKLTARSDV
jgi:hypothetical protein